MKFKGKVACCSFIDIETTQELMKDPATANMLIASMVGPFGVSVLPILPMEKRDLEALRVGPELIEFVMDAKELGFEILIFNIERGR